MKKIIITIPCHNEELLIEECLNKLHNIYIEGFIIETLVIDDGSYDKTFQIALESKANHIFRNTRNLGLARTFQICLEKAIINGADYIVNFDADIQYNPNDIHKLIEPLVEHRADIVIGERDFDKIRTFNAFKKFLQRFGSFVVSLTSGIKCNDCTSGFRSYTRKAASEISVSGRYTYTLETLYLSNFLKHNIKTVKISTTKYFRPSRLLKSNFGYVIRSIRDISVNLSTYKPMRLYFMIYLFPFMSGLILGLRYLFFHLRNPSPLLTGSYFPSLILSSTLLLFSIIILISGAMSESILSNKKLAIESRSRDLLNSSY